MTIFWPVMLLYAHYLKSINYFLSACFLFGASQSNNTGNKTRLVKVAVNKVTDVNHPNAFVPPKPLKQNMIKPATNTNDV